MKCSFKWSLFIFSTCFTVHFYPQIVCRLLLLYCFQTRPVFCPDVLLVLLEVGALTATLPPWKGDKQITTWQRQCVLQWQGENSRAVTGILCKKNSYVCHLNTRDLRTYILMYATMMTAKRTTAQVDVISMTFAEKTHKKQTQNYQTWPKLHLNIK